MDTLKFLTLIVFLFACNTQQSETTSNRQTTNKSTFKKDTTFHNDWQQGFELTHNPDIDSIWGKPVKYYITNPKCSPLAVDFYKGIFRPTDNDSTANLLLLATTDNNKLRPFYRWCLNKTIQIQDGALGEYTGVPARRYAEKFPLEFFKYMDYDSTGGKYLDWVNSILYSGFNDEDDYKKPKEIRKRMAERMISNCPDCSEKMKQRINKFAKDCFQ
jgi:hypothetical protein